MALAINKLSDTELRSLLTKLFIDESVEIAPRAEGYYDVLQDFIEKKLQAKAKTAANLEKVNVKKISKSVPPPIPNYQQKNNDSPEFPREGYKNGKIYD